MKKLYIAFAILTMVAAHSNAIEKKLLKDINTSSMTAETQVTAKGGSENHVSLVWWIPSEFWKAVLSKDVNLTEMQKTSMIEVIANISLVAVVQADVSAIGSLKYYSKEEIGKNMVLSFVDSKGKKEKLSPLQKIDSDLELVLGQFKPILGSAMGNLGNNLHFYVFNDRSQTSTRILDPYQKGQIDVQLANKDKTLLDASIELPLNALFIPRKCSNGKDAHVSWNYCPWTGQKLED
ncbi:hypothetical protein [Undibacterium sp.]|uniref:hypothetical protein n=1 Tax=Undibacterium sp. TaxID=1914977 RepID=UPI003753A4B0